MANLSGLSADVRKIIFFSILAFGTILTYWNVEKYLEDPEQLLANADFTDGLRGWQVDGPASASVTVNSRMVRLQANDAESSLQLLQHLDPARLGQRVVLRGKIKTIDIQGGKKNWEQGRVDLIQYLSGKAVYSTPHLLVSLDGTQEWDEYNSVFPILSEATEVRLEIQLNHCVGELQFTDLTLLRLEENPVYRVARWVVLGAWAVFMGWIFGPGLLGSSAGRMRSFLVLLVCITILLGTTVPGAIKNKAKYELLNQAHSYASQAVEHGGLSLHTLTKKLKTEMWLRIDITKVAHFLLFALLGGLFVWQGRGTGRIFVETGILACSSELLQLFVDDRTALLGDVIIDLAGVGCAVLLIRIIMSNQRVTHLHEGR